MNRRTLLKTILPAAATVRQLAAQDAAAPQWGGPVLDTHLHIRGDADACFKHMQGCGVTHAVLLSGANDQERAKAEMEKRPGHFVRSVRADPASADGVQAIREALKKGAVSIGELKIE